MILVMKDDDGHVKATIRVIHAKLYLKIFICCALFYGAIINEGNRMSVFFFNLKNKKYAANASGIMKDMRKI